jgi:outer membrane protein insertion porin family
VAVTGANPELETLVYNTIRTKPGRAATRSQLQEDVNVIYATGYFASVKVTPEDTPLGVRVTFAVQPNPVFKELTIETVPATEKKPILPPEVVQETFGEQYGKILNLRELQEGIKKISEWYAEKGFDLAQIVGAPKVAEDGTVTLVIAEGVVENIQVRFFDAEDEPVEGRTRNFIVTREMQLKSGDVFNRFIAQLDLQRVFGLGLFEDVRLSFTPGEDPQEVIVNVDVVEGNTGSISAGGGFSSAAGLFATISYQQKNLFGNNYGLTGEFQLGERELLLDVSFTDPWIAGDPYRTSYSVNAFRRRSISLVYDGDIQSIQTAEGITLTPEGFTTFPGSSPRVVRTGGAVFFSRPIADSVFSRPDWRLSLGATYQNIRLENSDGDLRPYSASLVNQFGQFWPSQQLAYNQGGVDDLFIVNFIASQDFRNNALQPTSGYVLRLGMEQSVPLSSSYGITFNRLRGSYSYYIPVNWLDFSSFLSIFGVEEEPDKPKPQALAFNFQAGTVLGDLPPYEASVLGGSNSVRGYAEGEVGNGRSFVQATAEYRFPIIPAVGVAVFFDYGSVLGSDVAVIGVPSLVRGLPGWGYGYGIGVRVQSPVGAIRVDYGINNEGNSRVSFGIGERF